MKRIYYTATEDGRIRDLTENEVLDGSVCVIGWDPDPGPVPGRSVSILEHVKRGRIPVEAAFKNYELIDHES